MVPTAPCHREEVVSRNASLPKVWSAQHLRWSPVMMGIALLASVIALTVGIVAIATYNTEKHYMQAQLVQVHQTVKDLDMQLQELRVSENNVAIAAQELTKAGAEELSNVRSDLQSLKDEFATLERRNAEANSDDAAARDAVVASLGNLTAAIAVLGAALVDKAQVNALAELQRLKGEVAALQTGQASVAQLQRLVTAMETFAATQSTDGELVRQLTEAFAATQSGDGDFFRKFTEALSSIWAKPGHSWRRPSPSPATLTPSPPLATSAVPSSPVPSPAPSPAPQVTHCHFEGTHTRSWRPDCPTPILLGTACNA